MSGLLTDSASEMFRFKQFCIDDSSCAMKVGTDAVLLGCWANVNGIQNIVDAGCGSGVISLMMAQRSQSARIFAVDIDPVAAECCRANADASPWPNRVVVMTDDISLNFPSVESPLLIISNPPFFNEPLKSPEALRALARHGVTFGVETLIEIGARYLREQSDSLAFIAPASRKEEIDWLLTCARLTPIHITDVYSKEGKAAIRTLWQVTSEKCGSTAPCVIDSLYIRDRFNAFSEQYLNLTSPFYLDK